MIQRFPWQSMVQTDSNAGDMGSLPGQETKIPPASQSSQSGGKKEERKKIQNKKKKDTN